MKKRISMIFNIILTVMLFSVWQANAGNPAGPGTPPASTSSYTLEDIYNRLNTGTAATQSTFTEPTAGPSTGTMHTLNEIYDLIGAPGKVAKTGQTKCHDSDGTIFLCSGSSLDGDVQAGVAWPNPRFTDNSDGTVTDNLTGLIWLKNANCFGVGDWTSAVINSRNLQNGGCGLTDGSASGDWRLPNVRELQSLIHYGVVDPAIPNTAGTGKWTAGDPFTNVPPASPYWTSTTMTDPTTSAWTVLVDAGGQEGRDKIANSSYYWPVRDAE